MTDARDIRRLDEPKGILDGRTMVLLVVLMGLFSSVFHAHSISPLPWYLHYSDIVPFFAKSRQGWPYIDTTVEYPVLTGWFIFLCGSIGQSRNGYYLYSCILLVAFAGIATRFLYLAALELCRRDPGSWGRARAGLLRCWFLAPSMFIFLIFNWDMMAVMCVAIALYLLLKDRYGWAAVFIALGCCAKFYPVIYLWPMLVKQEKWRERLWMVVIFTLVVLAANLPLALISFEKWSYFFAFNSTRSPNVDSIWDVIMKAAALKIAAVNQASLLLFAGSSLATVWFRRRDSIVNLMFIMTLLFLITNKVFSPQYLLWLLPFFALSPFPAGKRFYALEISNVLVLLFSLMYLLEFQGNQFLRVGVAVLVVVRHVILLYTLYRTCTEKSRTTSERDPRGQDTSRAGPETHLLYQG